VKKELRLRVNGEEYELFVEPTLTLQDALRDELKLKGTKKGCETGYCGVCTVILDGRAVKSCLILALQAQGKEVLTIEGLTKDGKLHPLQEAFVEYGAIQCGYCTPGMILMAKSFLDENPNPTEEEIREALIGNLCRCTGYASIVDAIKHCTQKKFNVQR